MSSAVLGTFPLKYIFGIFIQAKLKVLGLLRILNLRPIVNYFETFCSVCGSGAIMC